MFRIKICGITSASDAVAAADAGADAIGLNFFRKSRRFVQPEIAARIATVLPPRIARVGVFVNHAANEIQEVLDQLELDMIQLHGDEPASILTELPSGIRVVRACRCGPDGFEMLQSFLTASESIGRLPSGLLIDASTAEDFGGTGQLADWNFMARHRSAFGGVPLILAGGLTPENVAEAIATVRPDGVDVASGVERQPGVKDGLLVKAFVEQARSAFEQL
jgi:phosphoribosylanthranilate isomerase